MNFNEKIAYFISETEHDKDGYTPCIVKENSEGYYPTDWKWKCSLEEAEKHCEKLNERMGISKEEVDKLILKSMYPNKKNR